VATQLMASRVVLSSMEIVSSVRSSALIIYPTIRLNYLTVSISNMADGGNFKVEVTSLSFRFLKWYVSETDELAYWKSFTAVSGK
jgi:hypothetical protein